MSAVYDIVAQTMGNMEEDMSSIPQLIAPTKTMFLSIDLDFWNERSLSECRKVFDYIHFRHKRVPIVDEHHDLIPHIEACKPDTVINIDFHSDIANNESNEWESEWDSNEGVYKADLNCGTWANWIEKSFRQHFLWVYPSGTPMKEALCHSPTTPKYDPFSNPSIAGWKRVSKKAVKSFPYYLIDQAKAVGIAISDDWLNMGKAGDMKDILKDIFGRRKVQKALDYSAVIRQFVDIVTETMEEQ